MFTHATCKILDSTRDRRLICSIFIHLPTLISAIGEQLPQTCASTKSHKPDCMAPLKFVITEPRFPLLTFRTTLYWLVVVNHIAINRNVIVIV